MPILRDPAEAANRIGFSLNNRTPNPTEPKFRAMLENATTRIANLLSVQLQRARWVDTFELPSRFLGNSEELRLCTGFLVPDSVTVIDPYGKPVNSERLLVKEELGTVVIGRPRGGTWRVEYEAGFKHNDEDPAIYLDTPEWLVELIDTASVAWARITLADKTPDSVSYSALMNAIYRDLAGRAHSRYDRPRTPAHFPVHSRQLPVD